MPIIRASDFELVDRPEVIIGLAAPVGTPLGHVSNLLKEALEAHDYEVREVRISDLISAVEPLEEDWEPRSQYERLSDLMNRGNAARSRLNGGEVLAVLAAAEISATRPNDDLPAHDGCAFIVRQFKHPDEVSLFRHIYGEAFHLVGVHCPESTRKTNLEVNLEMSAGEAQELIERDLGEEQAFGQQLRDTFHLADVIVPFYHPDRVEEIEAEVNRYVALLFGDRRDGIHSPTSDEYGMFLAYSASLRSADLSRQVGASILGAEREVLAVGCNEVPAAGGGQYWCDDPGDGRDFARGYDSNARIKLDALREILEILEVGFHELDERERTDRIAEVSAKLGPARIMNLTEFGRAVHAEMDALLAAGRIGVPVRGCDLFTTTFPCHNCAKHVVGAGISRVVYIEPYPKSLALDLHSDAIGLDDGVQGRAAEKEKVRLQSFVGVAPRRFVSLFSMLSPDGRKHRRKESSGDVLRSVAGLRTRAPALNYMQREATAAYALKDFLASQEQGELNLGQETPEE